MADTCPVCGLGYTYGPTGTNHNKCYDILKNRAKVDEAVAWIMAEKDDRGPEPELVTRLREELLTEEV